MKTLKRLIHYGLVVLHHLIAVFVFFLFLLLICVFFLFVAVKTNPRGTENLLSGISSKVLVMAKVEASGIKTKILDENIAISVESFKRQTKGVDVSGHDAVINFSLNDILHGSLYTITIKNFMVNIVTTPKNKDKTQNENERKRILTAIYSLAPSVRVEIYDFILNFNGSEVHLRNSLLMLNQGGYIIWVSTKSEEEIYKIYIALNAKILRISFNNVPRSFLKNYAQNILDTIHFDHISGFVEFKTKNLASFQYRVVFGDLSFLKSKFVPADVNLSNVVLSGEVDENNKRVIATNVGFKQSKISFDVNLGEKQHVFVKLDNGNVADIKPLIPWNLIKKTHFNSLVSYLAGALKSGILKDVMVDVNMPIQQPEDLAVKVNFENTEFEYNNNFAPIKEGYGFVDVNADRTIVLLDKGKTVGSNLKFLRVDVDHEKKIVGVNLDLNGDALAVANIFFPKNALGKYSHIVNGTLDVKANINLDIGCDNVLQCTNFEVIGNAKSLKSFLSDGVSSAFLKVSKQSSNKIEVGLVMQNFKNKYFEIRRASTDVVLDFHKHLIEISGNIMSNDKGSRIVDINAMKYDIGNGVKLKSINSAKVALGHNDVSFSYNGSLWTVEGKELSVISVNDLLSRLQVQKEGGEQKRNIPTDFNTDVHIDKVILHNDIQTPFDFSIRLKNKELLGIFLDTDIVRFHYFTSTASKKISKDLRNQGMFLDVPNLGTLAAALSETPNPAIRAGNVSIIGERDDGKEAVEWGGYLRNLDVKIKKITFNPGRTKINAIYDNNTIYFKNLKMRDKNHTMFFTGKIFTKSLTTKTKVFYTPSQIEFLNEIPFLKNAFKLTTFGGSKKGLISLEIDVDGSLLDPQVKFNKASSVASVGKLGFGLYGLTLLPLLLL